MKKILCCLLILHLTLLVGCSSSTIEFEKHIEEVKIEKEDIVREHPNTIDSKIIIQCHSKWLPYFKKIRSIVEVEYPLSSIELMVVDSEDHLNKVYSLNEENTEIADLFVISFDQFEEMMKNNKITTIDSDFIAASIGADINRAEYQFFMDDNGFYGFPISLESMVVYLNEINATNENVSIEGNININSLEQQNGIIPIYDKAIASLILPQVNFNFLSKSNEEKMSSDFNLSYKELSPENQAFFEATYEYWRQYTETDVWNPGLVESTIYESFKTGGKNTLLIGTSDMNHSTYDLSKYSGIKTVELNQVTFANLPLQNYQNGWALVVNKRIQGDKSKKTLIEVFTAELLRPINASEFYNYTHFIMPHGIEKDYDDLDGFTQDTIKTVLASYSDLNQLNMLDDNELMYELWKEGILSWEVEKPKKVEDAYKILQRIFLSQVNLEENDD